LYLDGGQVDSTGSGPKPSGDRTFKIGGQTDFGHYWDGRIDDVRVYDKALSDSEVSNLYANGAITDGTPFFDATITNITSPVKPGNTLDVTVDVTNNGTDSDTQTVTLSIDNGVGQVDSTSVTLSGGGSTTQTLSWSVPSGQTEQDYTATVASADDTASQTVTVNSVTVVDDFEDGNLAEYTDQSEPAASATITNQAFAGSHALELTAEVVSGPDAENAGVFSGSGLPNYPSAGDTFEFRFFVDDANGTPNDTVFGFFAGGFSSNNYEIRFDHINGRLRFEKRDGSGFNPTTVANVAIPTQEWLRCEVDTTAGGGTITVTLDDSTGTQLATGSVTDSTFTSGGIFAFHSTRLSPEITQQGDTTRALYDNIQII
jgi:hypothetical protein